MKKSKKFLSLGVATAACLVTVVAIAASSTNQGATPKGKPFVQLQTAINDLQAQIDVLVGDVDSLEGRVSGLEKAVGDLQTETAALNAQIEDLTLDVEANEQQIVALGKQVIDNQNMIAMMQDQISHIEDELAQKQNIVTGTCTQGTALTEIRADGSVVCSSKTGGIFKFTVSKYVMVPKGEYTEKNCNYSWSYASCYSYTVRNPQTRSITVTCPADSFLISGSTDFNGLTLNSQGEKPVNAWTATATNYSKDDHFLFAHAICVDAN